MTPDQFSYSTQMMSLKWAEPPVSQHLSPVGFIKHHILHRLKLQVHLHDHVHQTSRCTDDAVNTNG